MKNKPLLSICIPTRNRADVLEKCLNSIVNDQAFNDDVEVVVSDNCSEDNTQDLVKSYTECFENVKYFRNAENIGVCRNIEQVLNVAQGEFLKLNNDYSVFNEGALKFLVDTVKNNIVEKPVLYFHQNQNLKNDIYEVIESFDLFLKKEGWSTSWIGSYGYWENDFQEFDDRCRREKRFFVIIDWFIRSFKKKRKIICCNKNLTTRYPFKEKQGGYNFIEIHTRNFIEQYENLVKEGLLKESSIEYVKRVSLLPSMIQWAVKLKLANKGKFSYDSQKSFEIIKREFGYYSWYRKDFIKHLIQTVLSVIKREYIMQIVLKILHRGGR